MPVSFGNIDHTMLPSQGLNFQGMPIWDDRSVPSFEKHSKPLGIVGKDRITLASIKDEADRLDARGLSVDQEGKFYAVKRPSQVEGFGNKIKVYSAATLYAATEHPRAAVAVLGGTSLVFGATAIYEGVKRHELFKKMNSI